MQSLTRELDQIKLMTGRVLAAHLKDRTVPHSFADVEFKVFSQFGDDGIIQFLLSAIPGLPQTFIEFGVENYREANTRFLLLNNNWKGLILDSSSKHINHIHQEDFSWRHDLTAVEAFITRENVNSLFRDNGFEGEIGILSIDIDGNDYWVWEAVTVVDPVVVVVEYNSVFGPRHAITIPYQPDFYRTNAHRSNLYWGCSVSALCRLAERKGYSFVGSNSAGNNAYFVRKDRMGKLQALKPSEGYVESRFRESRDETGRLTHLSGSDRIALIIDMPVYDVDSQRIVTIKELDRG